MDGGVIPVRSANIMRVAKDATESDGTKKMAYGTSDERVNMAIIEGCNTLVSGCVPTLVGNVVTWMVVQFL